MLILLVLIKKKRNQNLHLIFSSTLQIITFVCITDEIKVTLVVFKKYLYFVYFQTYLSEVVGLFLQKRMAHNLGGKSRRTTY